MILDAFDDLNWLAVIVAALAWFAFGAAWYSDALFGKQYRAAIGQEEGSPMNTRAIVINLIAWLVSALVMGLFAKAIGAETFADGLVLGLAVWIGFIVTNRAVAYAYEGPNNALAKVNGPYNAIGFMLMGVILALWQ